MQLERRRGRKERGEMRVITEEGMGRYEAYLREEERSENTVRKYIRDLRKLMRYADGREITKELVMGWKEYLQDEMHYKATSINSFIVAVNRFFEYAGWHEVRIRTLRIQQEAFCPEGKELTKKEYKRLVGAAERDGKERLAMIILTLGATGIRVGELSAVTVEGVGEGTVEVDNKGKIRKVVIPDGLRAQLLAYAAGEGIRHGVLFRTRSGRPVSRCNVWRDMKAICQKAGVEEAKVFPHNLRHLFAKAYHKVCRDITKLADILGHSHIETTRIYLRTSSRKYQEQLERTGLVLQV